MGCKNVLIIEDDRAVRETIQDILEIEGFTVVAAENGKEGIEKLRAMSPKPCMVLLDLMMPTMNGWQFLDLQRTDPTLEKIPIVVCSAYHESAKSVRPAAVVPKPVELPSLMSAITSFCL